MQITEITVSAARTINHPVENYANLKPMVSLKAVLGDGDDYSQAVKDLQAKAEELVEDHATQLKKHIRDMYYLDQKQKQLLSLEASLHKTQRELEAVRAEMPLMSLPSSEVDVFFRGRFRRRFLKDCR